MHFKEISAWKNFLASIKGLSGWYYILDEGSRMDKRKDWLSINMHTHTSCSDQYLTIDSLFERIIGRAGIIESPVRPFIRFITERLYCSHIAITDHKMRKNGSGVEGAIKCRQSLMYKGLYNEIPRLLMGEEQEVLDAKAENGGLDTLLFYKSNMDENSTMEQARKEFSRMRALSDKLYNIRFDFFGFYRMVRKLQEDGELSLVSIAHIAEPIKGNIKPEKVIALFEDGLIDTIEVANASLSDFQREFQQALVDYYGLKVTAGSDVHAIRFFLRRIAQMQYKKEKENYTEREIYELVKTRLPDRITGTMEYTIPHTIFDAYYAAFMSRKIMKLDEGPEYWDPASHSEYLKKAKTDRYATWFDLLTSIVIPVAPFETVRIIRSDRARGMILIEGIIKRRPDILYHMQDCKSSFMKKMVEKYS